MFAGMHRGDPRGVPQCMARCTADIITEYRDDLRDAQGTSSTSTAYFIRMYRVHFHGVPR
jgi:hypothetical protein